MPRRAFIASIIRVCGNVNADMRVGTRIPLKKIFTQTQETRVFVSARCIRRCIRERLAEKFGADKIDPLHLVGGGEQQLGDIGDPVKYLDDDLFGYLVPEDVPRKRTSPVKTSHLISLHHVEVKPEFAARFPREMVPKAEGQPKKEEQYPVPFEVEVADWLGRLEVIISDRIGAFEKGEVDEKAKEAKGVLERRGDRYYLDLKTRRERLKGLLEVLLWEGWQFPRAAQSPSVPEFYYALVVLTNHFTPVFGYLDVDEGGKLSQTKLENLRKLYKTLIHRLFLLDYRNGSYQEFVEEGGDLREKEKKELNLETVQYIIKEICGHVLPS